MSLDRAKVFLFDVNFNEELRTKLKEQLPSGALSREEKTRLCAEVAVKLGYDINEEELREAMLESGDNDALELQAVTGHAGVCTSLVQNRDVCAASVESGIWCTAQTSPATVGGTFMSM